MAWGPTYGNSERTERRGLGWQPWPVCISGQALGCPLSVRLQSILKVCSAASHFQKSPRPNAVPLGKCDRGPNTTCHLCLSFPPERSALIFSADKGQLPLWRKVSLGVWTEENQGSLLPWSLGKAPPPAPQREPRDDCGVLRWGPFPKPLISTSFCFREQLP